MAPNDQQPPWGQRKKPPSSPEDLLATIIQKIRDAFAGQEEGPSQPRDQEPQGPQPGFLAGLGKAIPVIVVIMIFQVAYASFFTIAPG